jgi:glutamate synthase domain-containing protein 3
MTGGTVVVLGPIGANFGAGMTGGRAYLFDPDGRHLAALDGASVTGTRLSTIVADRADGPERAAEFDRLMRAHRGAGSVLAAALLEDPHLASSVWLVEPVAPPSPAEVVAVVMSVPALGAMGVEPSPPGVSAPSI